MVGDFRIGEDRILILPPCDRLAIIFVKKNYPNWLK